MLLQFLRFLIVVATLVAGSLNARQPMTERSRSEWARVQGIQPKQKILVKLGSGKTLSGKFVDADPEGVVLLRGGKQTTKIPRAEILLISKKSGTGKGALIGLAAGAGSGMILAASSPGDMSRGRAAALACVPMAAIGAGLGAIIGALTKPAITIYEATSATP
jgi:hypothetical protein